MLFRKFTMLPLLLLLTLFAAAQNSEIIKNYIKTYRSIAITEMHRTGVPAAIKLAQGIHESMAGQSELVMKSNNHFGVKCKSDYTGPYVLHDDDRPRERFMKYESPQQSYIDQSDFLRGKQRYASLFDLDPTDYKGWAYGLKQAGYATNPKYPQLLINIIEKYNLQDYTLIALGKAEMPNDLKELFAAKNTPEQAVINYPENDFKINETRVVYVKKGSNLYDISKKYNVPLEWLYSFNDFATTSSILPKNQLVYLQLKRTVGHNDFHEVKEGESLYDIAQAEAIRLESLLKYNKLTKFASPAIGAKLYLKEPANEISVN